MRKLAILAGLAALVGCVEAVPEARPTAYSGKYYMMGDPDCMYGSGRSDGNMICFNVDKKVVGYRKPMTDQEIAMWQYQQEVAARKAQETAAASQQFAEDMAAVNAQQRALLGNMSMNTSYPPVQFPGSNRVTCIGVGPVINCQ